MPIMSLSVRPSPSNKVLIYVDDLLHPNEVRMLAGAGAGTAEASEGVSVARELDVFGLSGAHAAVGEVHPGEVDGKVRVGVANQRCEEPIEDRTFFQTDVVEVHDLGKGVVRPDERVHVAAEEVKTVLASRATRRQWTSGRPTRSAWNLTCAAASLLWALRPLSVPGPVCCASMKPRVFMCSTAADPTARQPRSETGPLIISLMSNPCTGPTIPDCRPPDRDLSTDLRRVK